MAAAMSAVAPSGLLTSAIFRSSVTARLANLTRDGFRFRCTRPRIHDDRRTGVCQRASDCAADVAAAARDDGDAPAKIVATGHERNSVNDPRFAWERVRLKPAESLAHVAAPAAVHPRCP